MEVLARKVFQERKYILPAFLPDLLSPPCRCLEQLCRGVMLAFIGKFWGDLSEMYSLKTFIHKNYDWSGQIEFWVWQASNFSSWGPFAWTSKKLFAEPYWWRGRRSERIHLHHHRLTIEINLIFTYKKFCDNFLIECKLFWSSLHGLKMRGASKMQIFFLLGVRFQLVASLFHFFSPLDSGSWSS